MMSAISRHVTNMLQIIEIDGDRELHQNFKIVLELCHLLNWSQCKDCTHCTMIEKAYGAFAILSEKVSPHLENREVQFHCSDNI